MTREGRERERKRQKRKAHRAAEIDHGRLFN